jgi:hypothetical protein
VTQTSDTLLYEEVRNINETEEKKDLSPENERQEDQEHGLTENLHLNHRVVISGDCLDLKATT